MHRPINGKQRLISMADYRDYLGRKKGFARQKPAVNLSLRYG